ncbi:ABC transporter permease [Sphingomonas sp.]|uniref:ABC transporter permease n=1 Tax=Sphingomonas sp. TaxID=28214 RepID=UPI003AFFC2DE
MMATVTLLALRAIRRHMLRSFLTILGIVIGVFAVVTMVTLGDAVTKSVHDQISSLGSNVLTLVPGQGRRGDVAPAPFKQADADAIAGQVGGVTAVSPLVTTAAIAVRNVANWSTMVTGVGDAYLDIQSWQVVDGRRFTAAEEEAGKAVCLLGTVVRDKLYAQEEPVGTYMRLGVNACEVIGVLASRGGGVHQDEDDAVVLPIKAVQRRFTGSTDVRAIVIAADPAFDSKDVQASIASLMRQRRNVAADQEDDFTIFDVRQIADTLGNVTGLLTEMLGAVAGISLLVGGIGIMNIMLVSVTERTREIGIRLAIGAVQREVMLQFLVEAVVLSCLGGVIGLVLALAATIGLSAALGLGFVFEPGVNLLAFAFSALIGVVFGYFPARRAASLNPIDALRHE